MKVQDVGCFGLVLTKEVSMPNCFRSCSTNSPKRSSPTLPNTLGLRPRRLKLAAVFAAHPPTLTRYLSMRHNSPAAGSESRLLPNTSATSRPKQTTSAISAPMNLVAVSCHSEERSDEESAFAVKENRFHSPLGMTGGREF